MAFTGQYKCTKCNRHASGPEELTAKKVMFQELGERPSTLRSRTVDWLCAPCLIEDPAWMQELYDSPGLRLSREASEN